ncbi:type II toxin-antitoxin system HicB family antitoxin [uncultured Roseibium sp.]|uniref:type II toxin-antitoxin system HicB family antitoxin n=1 Tax=uncultured Roseibium sp. TaxID=1936171 RepID=UPI002618C975|nr:type II toxin-antitoxin system HicB family antitoxin [uncultured Roseibium sp.]
MLTFFALVHQEDDSAYGVQFPDVAGCFSAADDMEQVIRNASEALALHLEDGDLPAPRSLAEIKKDEDVAAELAHGAFLIAVPLISFTGRSKKANITMDAGLLQAIDDTASARDLTRSAYLASLARRDISG